MNTKLSGGYLYKTKKHPKIREAFHLFTFKLDASGNFAKRDAMEYILKEFRIEKSLLEKHTSIDEVKKETTIKLPFA